MNILSLNKHLHFQKINPVFQGRRQTNELRLKTTQGDTVELSYKFEGKVPDKIELSETEKAFNELVIERRRLDLNIETQKNMLKQYYSVEDKCDYRELLKKRRNLVARLKKMAAGLGVDMYEFEYDISAKKDYNFFAPKILRTKTVNELKEIITTLKSENLFIKTRVMLNMLIEQHLKTLN